MSVVVPLIITIVGGFIVYVLYGRYQRSVRVRIVKRSSRQSIEAFVRLYSELIPESDQLSPDQILTLLDDPSRSPRTIRDLSLASFWFPESRAFHMLLLARVEGQGAGFLKAIFLPDAQILFIAYIGAEPVPGVPSGRVTQSLVRYLNRAITELRRTGQCRWVVYEIAHSEGEAARLSKFRRFQALAHPYGCRAYRLGVRYCQPTMTLSASEMTRGARADLVVLSIEPSMGELDSFPSGWVRALIEAIYEDIYLESMPLAAPQMTAYRTYLARLADYAMEGSTALVPVE